MFIATASLIVGIHLGSYHFQGDFNNKNLGGYIQYNQLVIGGYKNSINNYTGYFGYVQKIGSIDVVIGTAGGYRKSGQLLPMIVPTYKFKLTESVSGRIFYIPAIKNITDSSLVHFSIEF